jgi:hypothetical protein
MKLDAATTLTDEIVGVRAGYGTKFTPVLGQEDLRPGQPVPSNCNIRALVEGPLVGCLKWARPGRSM